MFWLLLVLYISLKVVITDLWHGVSFLLEKGQFLAYYYQFFG